MRVRLHEAIRIVRRPSFAIDRRYRAAQTALNAAARIEDLVVHPARPGDFPCEQRRQANSVVWLLRFGPIQDDGRASAATLELASRAHTDRTTSYDHDRSPVGHGRQALLLEHRDHGESITRRIRTEPNTSSYRSADRRPGNRRTSGCP